MAAELGHQPGARAVVEPPADELVEALVAVLGIIDRLVLVGDRRLPRVLVEDVALVILDVDGVAGRLVVAGLAVRVLGQDGSGIVAMPEGADVADLAELAVLDEVVRVVVERRVVPLMADGEEPVLVVRDLDHLLALAHVVGHQLLAEDVLARLHRLDRDRRVQPQRQRDDDHLDVLVGEDLVEIVVDLELLDVVGRVVLVGEEFLLGPLALGGADVAVADVVDVGPVVVADHRLATLVAGADDRRLHGLGDAVVAEVEGAEGGGGGGGLEEVATGRAEDFVGIRAAEGPLLGGQVRHRSLRVNGSWT